MLLGSCGRNEVLGHGGVFMLLVDSVAIMQINDAQSKFMLLWESEWCFSSAPLLFVV